MNDLSQTMNQSYGIWPPPSLHDHAHFSNPNRPPPPLFAVGTCSGASGAGRFNWKAKKAAEKRKKSAAALAGGAAPPGSSIAPRVPGCIDRSSVSVYKPPVNHEIQFGNRVKNRKFYPKRNNYYRFVPFAPRNTSSYIIRAKKSGGIASLVSPCPVTPAVLPTPKFSPNREVLGDMAKEEWGVDGYGSMKGRIRLRSPNGYEMHSGGGEGVEDEDEEEEGSSESDVEEHLEMERRLEHDLSRFEMVYPTDDECVGGNTNTLENRVDDHDSHIAQLEEESLTLKERLFLMEQEMGDLRRRLLALEARSCDKDFEDNNTGENENDSSNEVNGVEEASEHDCGGDVLSEKSMGDCEESTGTPMH